MVLNVDNLHCVCVISAVFVDGTQKELFNLQGTIPVTYKGNCMYKKDNCLKII